LNKKMWRNLSNQDDLIKKNESYYLNFKPIKLINLINELKRKKRLNILIIEISPGLFADFVTFWVDDNKLPR